MRKLSGSLGLVVVFFLFGCSTGTVPNITGKSGSVAVQSPQGVVHGGQQAIASANINVWAVGATGYGSAPTLLYSTSTNGSGTFSFPIASWITNTNCTNVDSGSNSSIPVYITSSGGNAGSGTNGTILLMAALGPCNNINTSTFVNINEVTTVAAAYALGQFMNPANPAQIGYLSSQTGIQNAFTTAGNLANVSAGTANALTPNGNGAIPQTEINTLADILASCVNGSFSGSGNSCSTLFTDAFNSSGSTLGTSFSTPTNTLMAAQQIAAYPGNNVGALWGLTGGIGAPFQSTLVSAPNDWTIAVQYAAHGADQSTNPRVALAVDNSDNIWIANFGESNVEELNNQGVPAFSPVSSGISMPTGLAIDTQGNAWVSNIGNNTVFAVCPGGVGQCSNTFNNTTACSNNSPCGINQPIWLAFDGSGNLWVVNNGTASLTELFGVGNNSSNNNEFAIYTPSSVVNPEFVALDLSGNAWVADYGSGKSGADAVEMLSAHGVSLAKETGNALDDPEDLAIDRSGNIWVGSKADAKLTEYNSSGTVLSPSGGFGGGGIDDPTVVAVDGANRIWTSNWANNSISEFSNTTGTIGTAISPAAGYKSNGLNEPSWLAIDKSGNVWVSSSTPTAVAGTSFYGAITEFVGAAAPVVTPQMNALQSGQLAVTPGTPTPVSILTNTLPYYAITTGGYSHPYSAQLQALGGSSSYTWSTTSTTILTNAGLSLSTAGLISGTPIQSGPLSINVTVSDSSNGSNTASTTLTLNSADQMTTSLGANDSKLKGTYTFLIRGMRNSATSAGSAPMTFYLGSMTADGSGHLTGEFDGNSSGSGLDGGFSGPVAFTGYYTIDSSNTGLITLLPQFTGQGALSLAFSAGNLGTSPAVYQSLEIIRYDDTGAPNSGSGTNEVGSGFAKLQTSTTLAAGSWVFGFDGETPCTTAGGNSSCTAGLPAPYGPLSAAGVFTANSSGLVTTGEEDASAMCPQSASNCAAYNYNEVSLAGSYGTADSAGRGTITLTPTGSLYPDVPTHYLYYVVGPTEVVMMSSDSHVTYSLMGGDVALQQGTISNSTFANGMTVIPYGLYSIQGDGVSVYPTHSIAQVMTALVTNPDNTNCSGLPSLGLTMYQNYSGNYQAQPVGTMCVSIASNGRMTFPGAGFNAPVGYVASSGLTLMDSQVSTPGDSPGVMRTELQTATAFTTCNMFSGTLPPPVPMTVIADYLSASSCPASTYSYIGFASISYGLLESFTGTVSIGTPNSSGVITGETDSEGSTSTIVVISGTRGVVLDADPGDTTPKLSILQK
jgi:sugar lactone lactonase YvrE